MQKSVLVGAVVEMVAVPSWDAVGCHLRRKSRAALLVIFDSQKL